MRGSLMRNIVWDSAVLAVSLAALPSGRLGRVSGEGGLYSAGSSDMVASEWWMERQNKCEVTRVERE